MNSRSVWNSLSDKYLKRKRKTKGMIDNDRLARSYRNDTCFSMFHTIIHYRFLYEKKQKINITQPPPCGGGFTCFVLSYKCFDYVDMINECQRHNPTYRENDYQY